MSLTDRGLAGRSPVSIPSEASFIARETLLFLQVLRGDVREGRGEERIEGFSLSPPDIALYVSKQAVFMIRMRICRKVDVVVQWHRPISPLQKYVDGLGLSVKLRLVAAYLAEPPVLQDGRAPSEDRLLKLLGAVLQGINCQMRIYI